jgi:hypothetical protein
MVFRGNYAGANRKPGYLKKENRPTKIIGLDS